MIASSNSASLYPIPSNESERLQIIRNQNYFQNFESNRYLSEITKLAASYFNCPFSLITFVDANRVGNISQTGLEEKEFPREEAFCTYNIFPEVNEEEVMVVFDATQDTRFSSTITVNGPLQIRFYAGAPIIIQGVKIGSLCIMDNEIRAQFSEEQQKVLREMSGSVATILTADEQSYIVEDHLIIPIITSTYQELLKTFNQILSLRKEKQANEQSATVSSYLIPFSSKSSKSGTNNVHRKSSGSQRPEIQIKWNTLKQTILKSHLFMDEQFLTKLKNSSSQTYPMNMNPQQQLYSFHLPHSGYLKMPKYIAELQRLLSIDRAMEMKIRWDYEIEEDDEYEHDNELEIGKVNQQWVSLILSLLFNVQLQRWKGIKVNASISGEDAMLRPPPTLGLTGHSQPATPSNLIINSPNEPPTPGGNNNIGVITFHLDITCSNRLHTNSWMMEDSQFLHEIDTLLEKTWQLLQGKYQKDHRNTKISEVIRIAFPVVCTRKGGFMKNSGNRSPKRHFGNRSPIPHLRLYGPISNSVRSFNRSFNRSYWFRSDRSLKTPSPTHRTVAPNGGLDIARGGLDSGMSNAIALNTLDESKGVDQSSSDKKQVHGEDHSETHQLSSSASASTISNLAFFFSFMSGRRNHHPKIIPEK